MDQGEEQKYEDDDEKTVSDGYYSNDDSSDDDKQLVGDQVKKTGKEFTDNDEINNVNKQNLQPTENFKYENIMVEDKTEFRDEQYYEESRSWHSSDWDKDTETEEEFIFKNENDNE